MSDSEKIRILQAAKEGRLRISGDYPWIDGEARPDPEVCRQLIGDQLVEAPWRSLGLGIYKRKPQITASGLAALRQLEAGG